MREQYEKPVLLVEKFDLDEAIALNIWGESAPDIGDGDGEEFGF